MKKLGTALRLDSRWCLKEDSVGKFLISSVSPFQSLVTEGKRFVVKLGVCTILRFYAFCNLYAELLPTLSGIITKTCLFKYIENFTTKKKRENFQIRNSDIFHISAQNIDCGYPFEPPR